LTLYICSVIIIKVFPKSNVLMGVIFMPYEKLSQTKSPLIIGVKQTIKAIKSGSAAEVYIAKDVEEHIVNKVKTAAENHSVPITFVDSKKQLGIASKIDVNASAVVRMR